MPVMKASAAEKEEKCEEWLAAIEKEVEPLLADAKPFFGGSKELTFAEVIVAPFLIRMFAMAEIGGYIPQSFTKKLDELPNFGPWAKAVRERKTVTNVWNGPEFVEGFSRKYGKQMIKA